MGNGVRPLCGSDHVSVNPLPERLESIGPDGGAAVGQDRRPVRAAADPLPRHARARVIATPRRTRYALRPMLGYVLYDLLGVLLLLAALPVLPVLALTRAGRGLGERLGLLPPAVRTLRAPVWIHAASVGEVLAAEPLVQQLRRRRPDMPVLVSTTSVTGRETARIRLAVDAVMLLPVDLRWLVDRVVRHVQPRCLVIVETELWPALFRSAARHGVPCILVSGRISAGAAAGYGWVRGLTRAMLRHVTACAMQTAADAQRIVTLGAPPERVRVLGSLKFARAAAVPGTVGAPVLAAAFGDRPVLVAASTHPGEERLVLDACAPLWAAHPSLLLVLAPRRPERFDEVAHLLAADGLRAERRSRLSGGVQRHTQVLLLDSLGELLDVLPGARGVFVGGTVAPVGGHNVLEPAIFSKPVAFGPHTENVAETAAALLEAGAAVEVRDAGQLAAEWRRVLDDPDAAGETGRRGRAVVDTRAAVAAETFELLQPWLDRPVERR